MNLRDLRLVVFVVPLSVILVGMFVLGTMEKPTTKIEIKRIPSDMLELPHANQKVVCYPVEVKSKPNLP